MRVLLLIVLAFVALAAMPHASAAPQLATCTWKSASCDGNYVCVFDGGITLVCLAPACDTQNGCWYPGDKLPPICGNPCN